MLIRGYSSLFFRVGFGLICDYRFQTMVLNRYGKCTCPEFIEGFAGRLKPLDDIHRRCQDKSLRAFVVKKTCLRNLRNQRLIKPVIIWVICDSITKHLFEKTNPIFPHFQPKNHDSANSKPIQSQFKPNPNPIFRSKNNSCQFVEFVVKELLCELCVLCGYK